MYDNKRKVFLMRAAIKHFSTIFLPLAVVLGAILFAFYRLGSNAERKIIVTNEAQAIDLQREVIARDFESIVSDLMFLSEQNVLKELLENIKIRSTLAQEWLSFARRKRMYDQIRFLDSTGMEIVRINNDGGALVIVPEERLQLKKDRYYFKDTFILGREEVFVSPFDLNIEQGKIEQPLKPMLRFGTPVFNNNGEKKGVLILNYLGAKLINNFTKISAHSLSQSMLLNSDGFWLDGPDAEQEWRFMYNDDGDRTFGSSFPDVWQRISRDKSGMRYTTDGLFIFRTVHPLFEGLKSSVGSGKPFKPSTRSIKAKEYIWHIVSYTPWIVLNAGAGKILRFLIVLYIILIILLVCGSWFMTRTHIKQKKAEKMLKDSERRFKSIFDHANDGIVLVEAKTKKFHAGNTMFSQMIGYNLEELKNLGVKDFHSTKDLSYVTEQFEKQLKGEISVAKDIPVKRKDNSIFYADINSTTIIIDEKMYMMGIFRDITERKRMEEEQEIMRENLIQSEKLASLGEMAAGIAHELNTPLNVILGYQELLIKKLDAGSPNREYVKISLGEAKRCAQLISDFLLYARPSDSDHIQEQKIDIKKTIHDALALMPMEIMHNVSVVYDIEENLPFIHGNQKQMMQMFINLGKNAVQAMHNGGTLSISAKHLKNGPAPRHDGHIEFRLTDTGIGIAKENLEKVFDPFFTTKRPDKGTGLGLSICMRIMKSHQGTIRVESEPGKGTTVIGWLPVSKEL